MNGINNIGRTGAAPRPPRHVDLSKPISQTRMSSSEYHRRYGGTTKAPKQVYKGRNNQENGRLFKIMLEAACEKYEEEKIAKISKAMEPFRIIGVLKVKPKIYKCVEEKEAEPDFKGIIASGRAIVFEAKTTEQECIEWGVVKEHQRQHLDDFHNMNGLAFVMVSFGLQNFYRVPWWVWTDMKALYGRKYLKTEDITEFEIPMMLYYGKPAVLFLEGMEEFREHEEDAL